MTLSKRIEDYCFFDFETRGLPGSSESDGSVVTAGTYRYAKHSFPIILTYAIGDDPVQCLAVDNFTQPDGSSEMGLSLPPDLQEFYRRAVRGEAWFVAWKTSFDRAIWNAHFPRMEPEMAIDAMCQALASNLPADLHSASVALGGHGKQPDGGKLIRMFSPPNGCIPQDHPEAWKRFKKYAVQDTTILRDIFRSTSPLMESEWREYWVSERINERGVAVDVAFCEKAAGLAEASIDWANRQLREITGSPTLKVSTPKQIARWVYERLDDPKAWEILEQELPDEDEDEESVATVATEETGPKLQLTRAHIIKLRNLLAVKQANGGLSNVELDVDTVLELREYGGAASISKFAKMAAQADDGRLKDSYVFNGAMQTGRFSSRGVQVHNLPRDSLGSLEETAIADIQDMVGHPGFDRHIDGFVARYGTPGKALSRLIRPALIAPKGKVLVWADWRNIEARVNPWLSLSRSGERKLDVFRMSDKHPDEPDVYMRTAADLLACSVQEVTKAQRQSHGKVPELSLGFGGGKDALLRMAATYNVALSDEQAQDMVERWRRANPWARGFWDELWTAITSALDNHNVIYEAGRVAYVFRPDYLGGTLFCALPDGRRLTYPQCRWENSEVIDKNGDKVFKRQLTYRKGHGRAALWYGKACENVVQATAGSLLRAKLAMLSDPDSPYWLPVVLHTHDDICVEVTEGNSIYDDGDLLANAMRSSEVWSEGLPLAVDVSSNWFFTKADD